MAKEKPEATYKVEGKEYVLFRDKRAGGFFLKDENGRVLNERSPLLGFPTRKTIRMIILEAEGEDK
jgi:hypothetical protein